MTSTLFGRLATFCLAIYLLLGSTSTTSFTYAQPNLPSIPTTKLITTFISKYCGECHSSNQPAADLDLTRLPSLSNDWVETRVDVSTWERLLRRLQTRQMPPPDADRPSEEEYVHNVIEIRIGWTKWRNRTLGLATQVRCDGSIAMNIAMQSEIFSISICG